MTTETSKTEGPQDAFHNVILFGAGASFDAGIPLLGSFVDKMWEYAIREKAEDKPISERDVEILTMANRIRVELESYNSRAFFDSKNLEDILSLLSFEALRGEEQSERYNAVVRAVARTIELSCYLEHIDGTPQMPFGRADIYNRFWDALLAEPLNKNLPAFVTFNYDLVLERSLWRFFHDLKQGHSCPLGSCGLKYRFGENDFSLRKVNHDYRIQEGRVTNIVNGWKAEYMLNQRTEAEIPYFKLHGSLNWSRNHPETRPPTSPTTAVDTPMILPPVFNKMSTGEVNRGWKGALEVLRQAKHIIIVGYSLPKTDIYMQYFLKSAVGPNSNLQKIIVFDPILFDPDSSPAKEMRARYSECFAPQFSGRIVFNPYCDHSKCAHRPDEEEHGSFLHLVRALTYYPDEILFFP